MAPKGWGRRKIPARRPRMAKRPERQYIFFRKRKVKPEAVINKRITTQDRERWIKAIRKDKERARRGLFLMKATKRKGERKREKK